MIQRKVKHKKETGNAEIKQREEDTVLNFVVKERLNQCRGLKETKELTIQYLKKSKLGIGNNKCKGPETYHPLFYIFH